jgi:hypothetical protein
LNLNNTNFTPGFTFDQEKFKDIVKEIKKNCEGQVSMKQKIISGQNEINKLSDIIEMNKNISSINNNLSNLISFTGTKNSKDKENSNNSNNSNNNNTSQEKHNLNEKIEELKKNLCSNQTIYKEFHKKIDKIINSNSTKKNLSQLQKDFLVTIVKNSNYKIQMLDIQYKNMLIKVKNEIKNNYIKELEKQIQYRDNLLQENNIEIYSKISLNNNNIKELSLLKKDYKQKISKNFHSNFGVIHQSDNTHYQNLYNTNPNKKNNNNLLPKSNLNNNQQLNRINIKFNTNINSNNNIINQRRQSHSKLTMGKRERDNKEKDNKEKEKENENESLRPGSKANQRQIHIKNRTNFIGNNYNKNLKRNNKSYAYKESKILPGKNYNNKFIDSKKNEVRSGSYDVMMASKHNKSFNEEENFNRFKELNFHLKCNSVSNRSNKNNENEGRFITFEEIPQVKKRELNYLLNERNKKRQKFLDKINAGNKDML